MKTRSKLGLLFLLTAVVLPASSQEGMRWRPIEPHNLVFMELADGVVVLELNPAFAPRTVERFRELVEGDFYRGLSFYRVIEGFVAQAGDESDINQPGSPAGLPAEFERAQDEELAWTPVQSPDLFAAETGFVDGFAAAREKDRIWLTHCPGVLAMARGEAPASGATDFYIVIGQAPRYLDRNLTIFGRVIDGMDAVQSINRGPTEGNGIILEDLDRSRILRMRLGDQLPEEERQHYLVMDTNSPGFMDLLKSRRDRDDRFFHSRPPSVLDVCQVPVATRVERPGLIIESPLLD